MKNMLVTVGSRQSTGIRGKGQGEFGMNYDCALRKFKAVGNDYITFQ